MNYSLVTSRLLTFKIINLNININREIQQLITEYIITLIKNGR